MSSKATATPTLLHKIGRGWSSPGLRPAFRTCSAVASSCCMRCQHLHSSSSKLSAQPLDEQTKAAGRKKITIKTLQHRYMTATPITMLTAYDYSSARFLDRSGIDVCLVGDSLAMVACGYPDTTELGMEEMLYHCRSVSRGAMFSLKIADMPFGSHQPSLETGITNAIRLVKEGGMEAVKIEGGTDVVPIVSRLVDIGIPVMAHVGLMPQRQASLSGYRVQGKTAESALKVLSDAAALQKAGAFAVILEAIPAAVAAKVTDTLRIPTIGIGASAACSGQVLVTHDMLGMTDRVPRFCKTFGNVGPASIKAMHEYAEAVKHRDFPQDVINTYDMPPEELQRFLELASDVQT